MIIPTPCLFWERIEYLLKMLQRRWEGPCTRVAESDTSIALGIESGLDVVIVYFICYSARILPRMCLGILLIWLKGRYSWHLYDISRRMIRTESES